MTKDYVLFALFCVALHRTRARLGKGCDKKPSDSANYFTLPGGSWNMDDSISNFKASKIFKTESSRTNASGC